MDEKDFVMRGELNARCKDCHVVAESKRDVQMAKIDAIAAGVDRAEMAIAEVGKKVNTGYTPPWQYAIGKAESAGLGGALVLIGALIHFH